MSDQLRRRIQRGRYPSLLSWRKALGLNQREAARVLEITQSKYSRLERGDAVAVRKEAKRLMSRTGVPVEVLAGAA